MSLGRCKVRTLRAQMERLPSSRKEDTSSTTIRKHEKSGLGVERCMHLTAGSGGVPIHLMALTFSVWLEVRLFAKSEYRPQRFAESRKDLKYSM